MGFLNAPLSRFMGALQWGRVIVLLSRGPPGEVNVYFCAVTCVFKEVGPRWLRKLCGGKVWNKPVNSSSIQHPSKSSSCPSSDTDPLLCLLAAFCHILLPSFRLYLPLPAALPQTPTFHLSVYSCTCCFGSCFTTLALLVNHYCLSNCSFQILLFPTTAF